MHFGLIGGNRTISRVFYPTMYTKRSLVTVKDEVTSFCMERFIEQLRDLEELQKR